MRTLPLPEFFDPLTVGHVWRVPYQQRAADAIAWAKAHAIRPSADDSRRIGLLLIDCQNTFCIPGFELFVAGGSGLGAVEDNRRLCEFLYRNLHVVTQVIATLDTHQAVQVFHASFVEDRQGNPPPPLTSISAGDVESGAWRMSEAARAIAWPEGLDANAYLAHYCRQLAARGKYSLMIWPYHAMLGGIGHAMVSAVEEACFFHGVARRCPTQMELKGANPLTEHYSALTPEVEFGPAGERVAQRNQRLIEQLLGMDMLIVAGQAKSHCVAWTVADLLSEIQTRDAKLAGNVYLLEDCTSPVVAAGADFSDAADEAFRRFAAAGMHIVRSTTPMADWPQ